MFYYLFFIIFIFIILHIYLHFCINNDNEITHLVDVSKENITNQVYIKVPFYFNYTLYNKDITPIKKKEQYIHECISYNEPLLEPYSKSTSVFILYKIPIDKYKIDNNLYCRTFYYVKKGTFTFICIHPKYKEHFIYKKPKPSFIKEFSYFITIELKEEQILFLPCYWYIYIEPLTKDSQCLKINYKTPLNETNFLYDKIDRYIKNV